MRNMFESVFKAIRALYAWQLVHDTGAHHYYENAVTGKRKVIDVAGGYQPVNWEWLAGGAWEREQAPLPMESSVKPPEKPFVPLEMRQPKKKYPKVIPKALTVEQMVARGIPSITVRVNGKVMEDCLAYSVDQGWALVHKRNKSGKLVLRNDRFVKTRVHGKVTLKWVSPQKR